MQWGVAGQMALALAAHPARRRGRRRGRRVGRRHRHVGTVIVALVVVAVAAGIYAASRRRPINADNVNDVPTPRAGGAAA